MATMDWPTRERKGRNAAGVGSRPRLRRDGLWCIHLSCGAAVDEQGKALRVRRSVYGRTAEEAERKAAALRAGVAHVPLHRPLGHAEVRLEECPPAALRAPAPICGGILPDQRDRLARDLRVPRPWRGP